MCTWPRHTVNRPKTTRGWPTGSTLTWPGRAQRSLWRGRRRAYGGRTWGRSSLQASSSYGAQAWQREEDQLTVARHVNEEGNAHRWQQVVRRRWSTTESGRFLARSYTTRGASGACHNTRRKTSSRGVLARRRGWVVTGAVMLVDQRWGRSVLELHVVQGLC
jgi:hypothetical protein